MTDIQISSFASEAGFQALFQYASVGLVVINSEGIIVLANPFIEKAFGYTSSEIVDQPLELLIPKAMRKKHSKHRAAYFDNPKARPMGHGLNLLARRKNGVEFPVEISLAHFEFYGSTHAVAFVTDITERITAEAAARQSEKEYRFIFGGIHESFMLQSIIKDNNGRVADLLFLEVNPATEKFLGKDRDAIIGHYRSEFLGPLDEEVIRIITQIEGTGENRRYHQYIQSLDRWFDRSFYSYQRGQLITLSIDITPQKQQEQMLLQSRQLLESEVAQRTHELSAALQREKELSDLKSSFMAIASHEFRTPLCTIVSSAALVEHYNKEDQDEKRKKHTARIRSAAQNLTDILDDFLSLDKLEQGKVDVSKESFNLYELANELIDEVNTILKPGQTIRFSCNSTMNIMQDKKIVRNILLNLLSNAIKYSPENKEIQLVIESADDSLYIKVKDEGIGIPEEDQKNLFNKFYRAKNTTNIQGTGLGLNIVKRYIELLNGTISFTSSQNQGSTFTIRLAPY